MASTLRGGSCLALETAVVLVRPARDNSLAVRDDNGRERVRWTCPIREHGLRVGFVGAFVLLSSSSAFAQVIPFEFSYGRGTKAKVLGEVDPASPVAREVADDAVEFLVAHEVKRSKARANLYFLIGYLTGPRE
jgi:hypothetical protein